MLTEDALSRKINGTYWPLYFFQYYLKCRMLGRRIPVLGGFKITNHCNLRCRHCPFWKQPQEMLRFEQVKDALHQLHRLGVRILIIEGGEPFLWHDEAFTLTDVINEAKKLFFSVGVTTNGTFPINLETNTVWVSLDGLRETNDYIRGKTFDLAMSNIEASRHPNLLANITINSLNWQEMPQLVEFLSPKVKGITIQFHYPYEESDLFLPLEERRWVLDKLIELKRAGLPVSDSYACLQALKHNEWTCHDWMLANAEPDGSINLGCYVKNRGAIMCQSCGFAAHVELSLAFDLVTEAFLAGRKIFRYGQRN